MTFTFEGQIIIPMNFTGDKVCTEFCEILKIKRYSLSNLPSFPLGFKLQHSNWLGHLDLWYRKRGVVSRKCSLYAVWTPGTSLGYWNSCVLQCCGNRGKIWKLIIDFVLIYLLLATHIKNYPLTLDSEFLCIYYSVSYFKLKFFRNSW